MSHFQRRDFCNTRDKTYNFFIVLGLRCLVCFCKFKGNNMVLLSRSALCCVTGNEAFIDVGYWQFRYQI